MHSIEVSYSM